MYKVVFLVVLLVSHGQCAININWSASASSGTMLSASSSNSLSITSASASVLTSTFTPALRLSAAPPPNNLQLSTTALQSLSLTSQPTVTSSQSTSQNLATNHTTSYYRNGLTIVSTTMNNESKSMNVQHLTQSVTQSIVTVSDKQPQTLTMYKQQNQTADSSSAFSDSLSQSVLRSKYSNILPLVPKTALLSTASSASALQSTPVTVLSSSSSSSSSPISYPTPFHAKLSPSSSLMTTSTASESKYVITEGTTSPGPITIHSSVAMVTDTSGIVSTVKAFMSSTNTGFASQTDTGLEDFTVTQYISSNTRSMQQSLILESNVTTTDMISVTNGTKSPLVKTEVNSGAGEFDYTWLIILGVSLGGIIFVSLIIGALALYFCHRRKPKYQREEEKDLSVFRSDYMDNKFAKYTQRRIELPKETSEEMISLDNDAFLNSLESSVCNSYWSDDARQSKL